MRADRTRDAIVDALLGLLEEGDLRPSAERIAERAGVSRRALFIHFMDREEMFSYAAARRYEKVVELLPIAPREGPTATRAQLFCAEVSRFYELTAPVRRAATLVAYESPAIASQLREGSRIQRAMIELVFAKEIEATPIEAREPLIAGLAAATSFSIREELREIQGLSAEETIRVMVRFVLSLLGGPLQDDSR